MFVLITKEALKRKWIYFESGGAYFLKKRVIPICCQGVEAEELGSPLNWLQAIHGWNPSEASKIPEEIARNFDVDCPFVKAEYIANICNGVIEQLELESKQESNRISPPSLPIFLLIDTSGSMVGNRIHLMQRGIELLVDKLRSISDATIMLSMVGFGSTAQTLLSLTPILEIGKIPTLRAGGGTNLGEAFRIVSKVISNPVFIPQNRYPPFIVVILDGEPTDDWESGLNSLIVEKGAKQAKRICFALGRDVDLKLLGKIGRSGVIPADKPEDLLRIFDFFMWLSSSIVSVAANEPDIQLSLPGWSAL